MVKDRPAAIAPTSRQNSEAMDFEAQGKPNWGYEGMAPTDWIATLKQDYQAFPRDQTYSLYAEDVQFRDPLNAFVGVERYRRMIAFIERWFINVHLELHEIRQEDNQILTRWTLSWQAPLPWRPQMTISGRSELTLNGQGLIQSHIDYWNCSRWDVLKQLFQ